MALLPKPVQDYVQADDDTNALAVSAPDFMVNGHPRLDRARSTCRASRCCSAPASSRWSAATCSTSAARGRGRRSAPRTLVSDAVKWPWELRIGYTPDREFTDALSLTLNLLSQNNEATIISNPQVMAEDGKEAQIKVDDGGVLPAHRAERHHLRADRTAADRDRHDPRTSRRASARTATSSST